MQQHPLLTVTKLGLLAVIAALLVLVFVAQNETQSKVIATRQSVDELRGQVAEVSRRVARGVPAAAGGVEAEPAGESRPIKPGFASLLSPEPDRQRPPDDEIDFDAQLRTATLSEPKGMNILTSDRDNTTATLFGYYVYAPLADRKDSDRGQFKPGLAERVEVSPDHREYYIRIRPGVLWHRPPVDLTDPKYAWMRGDHEVTADDLVFSLDMILNERADTESLRPEFKDIVEYKAVDPYTLYVRWKEPNFYSTGALLGDLVPFPKWIYTREEDGTPIEAEGLGQRFASHWFNKMMCGYGPYVFKEYKKGDYVLLERDEAYWGRRPAFKSVYYKLGLKDDEPRYNNFMSFDEKGERQQYAYPISSTRLKRDVYDNDGSSELLKQLAAKKLSIWGYQRLMYAYQGWACRSNLFSDPRVRRAMTMAANREAWQRDILVNEAVFPTGVAFPASPEYDKTIKPWPYDLAAAAKLLDEAGWVDGDGNGVREKMIDGQKVEFRFKVVQGSASPELEAIRNDWEQSLRKIGVIMEPDIVEWNQFLKRTQDREFQAYSAAWILGDEWTPESLHHSNQIPIPGSDNRVEWSNPRIDAIIDELKTTFDLKRRYELAHEFHRIFHEEQPYTILWSWRNSVALDSRIGGIENARSFLPQVNWLHIWRVKRGIAEYDDGRYERPKRPGT
jgi:ABC-type transport system substrate-binding protein